MLDSSYSFVTGSEKGYLDLYSPFEFEDKASSSSNKDTRLRSCYIMNRICHPNEGAIVEVRNKVFEEQREHCVVYCTQKGFIHIYDLRARNPVFDFDFGMKHGCISAMTLGPKEDQVLIGTVDGSLMTYDFRYNVQASYSKYTKDESITSLQSFYPNKYRKFLFNNANHMSPLAFVSTSDGIISLIDLSEKEDNIFESQLVLVSRTGKSSNQIGCFKMKEDTNLKQSMLGSVYYSMYQSVGPSVKYSTTSRVKNEGKFIYFIL